ncbi:SURF1 family protein [Spongisporangium articulatum]|uniref:SURF1-like protein n=1 Tax=Spongisporangium articulatum TaxID=3362603 RepID=A0ABW8ATT3_9ACTN
MSQQVQRPQERYGAPSRTMAERLAAGRERWPTRAEVRGALGLLRDRRWLLALFGVVLLSVLFVFLGRWQFHRHEFREARKNLVAHNYDAAPVDLAALDAQVDGRLTTSLPAHLQWRPVRVTGSYVADAQVLVRNKPRDGQAGFDVVVPIRSDDGLVLLVDRGWVPAGSDVTRPAVVPAVPGGQVTVVARLRPSEVGAERAANGQVTRIDVRALTGSGTAGGRVVQAYGQLVAETPAAPDTPAPADPPDFGIGINLAYAFQWWAFAAAAYVLFGVAMVREVRRLDQ